MDEDCERKYIVAIIGILSLAVLLIIVMLAWQMATAQTQATALTAQEVQLADMKESENMQELRDAKTAVEDIKAACAKRADGKVNVVFYSQNCPACHGLMPTIDRAAEAVARPTLRVVDMVAHPANMFVTYKIDYFPTVVRVASDGAMDAKMEDGLGDEAALRSFMEWKAPPKSQQ